MWYIVNYQLANQVANYKRKNTINWTNVVSYWASVADDGLTLSKRFLYTGISITNLQAQYALSYNVGSTACIMLIGKVTLHIYWTNTPNISEFSVINRLERLLVAVCKLNTVYIVSQNSNRHWRGKRVIIETKHDTCQTKTITDEHREKRGILEAKYGT